MSRRILLLFAHPSFRRSRMNKALVAAARDLDGVTVHDLYEAYPDFAIDVDREQGRLAEHDALVVQHPFFWYSAPAIVKEWQDLVLEHGWAYGRHGHALDGKLWMQAITAGGRDQAYGPGGLNRYSVDELLRPFEATANLCRMVWQRPFVVHATHIAEQPEIEAAATAYRARLIALRDGAPLRAVV
jgi:glutathione-regulated potassium-efflux system ancillary protein KefG